MDDLPHIIESAGFAAWLQLGGLVFARLMPIIAFTPLFGGAAVPRRLRTGMIVLLTVSLCLSMTPQRVAALPYAAMLVKELLVGLTLALVVTLAFEAVAAGGALIDLARGATLAGVLDPLTGHQHSPLAVFYRYVAVVLFLTLGGYPLLIGALADSFAAMPAYALAPPGVIGGRAVRGIVLLAGEMIVVAVKIAAPVIVLTLLIDVALGLINRVASRVEVFFLGMPAKSLAGLLAALLSLGVAFEIGQATLARMLRSVAEFMAGG